MRFAAEERLAGKTLKCPSCGGALHVPGGQAAFSEDRRTSQTTGSDPLGASDPFGDLGGLEDPLVGVADPLGNLGNFNSLGQPLGIAQPASAGRTPAAKSKHAFSKLTIVAMACSGCVVLLLVLLIAVDLIFRESDEVATVAPAEHSETPAGSSEESVSEVSGSEDPATSPVTPTTEDSSTVPEVRPEIVPSASADMKKKGRKIPVPARPPGVKTASSYAEALEKAKADQRDVLVLVHGSDWCRAGERFKESVWDNPKFTEALGDGFVRFNVDVMENPTEQQKQTLADRHKGFHVKFGNYPLLIMVEPDGTRYKTVTGSTFPSTREETTALILESRRARETRDYLLGEAERTKDQVERASILFEALQVGAGKREEIVEAVKQADPNDKSGYLANLTFDRNQVLARSRQLAMEEKYDEAIRWLDEMIAQQGLSVEQRQWVGTAKGQVLRSWEGHRDEAFAAYMAAHELDSESVPGIAAFRLGMKFASPILLEYGWDSSKCSTEDHDWDMDAGEAMTEAGVYEVEFKYHQGKSALSIFSVMLLDGEHVVSEDVHNGFAGSRHTRTTYRVTVPSRLKQPILRIRTHTRPNTDSAGRMTLKRVG